MSQIWLRTPDGRVYKPLPKQAEFHAAPDKYRAYIGGVGAGKSLAGCMEALVTALTHPGSEGLICRYTYHSLKETTWKTFRALIPQHLIVREANSPASTFVEILAPKGRISRVIGWNGTNWKNVTSLNLDWVYIDEVTEFPNDHAWGQFDARLRGGDLKAGPLRMWGTGTPAGHDWVWRRFVKFHYRGHRYVRARTLENIYLPPDYEAGLRRTNSEEWVRRFLLAEFNVFEGMIFHQWDPEKHIIDPFEVPDHWPWFRAIDPGLADPAACLWATSDEHGNLYFADEYYEAGRTVPEQVERIVKKTGSRKMAWTVIDPNAGGRRSEETGRQLIDQYREAGIEGLHLGNDNVPASIKEIQELLRTDEGRPPQMFIFRGKCPNLCEELGSWRWGNSGRPMKGNDHAIDCARYIVMRRPHPAPPKETLKRRPSAEQFWQSIAREATADLPKIGAGARGGLGV